MPSENPRKTRSVHKYLLTISICTGVAIIAGVGLWLGDSRESSQVVINSTPIAAEIADTPQEQHRGLSGRRSLSKGEGMLFIFNKSEMREFHMKDMKFSIDIIWMDQHRKIIDITHSLSPDTYPKTVSPRQPAQYVLEVPAGFSKEHNISYGDTASFQLN